MFGSAFSIALYVGSNIAYTADTQNTLTRQWEQSHPSIASSSAPLLDFARPRLAYGQPMAKIVVPSIDFKGVVLEGTTFDVLAGGPGHVIGSAYPGEKENVVISNHNGYSLSWGNVKVGDMIILQASYGTYNYRVTGFKIIDAKDTSVTGPTGRPMLTFTTCYPLFAGALASQRYVVFSDLVP
jgi:LPXTG-site transpeptidase (sortase) family protein